MTAATDPAEVRALREAPGHWVTDEGREMAVEYLGRTRESLCMGDRPDFVLANDVFMVDRSAIDLIAYQTAAKERIRWLSAQLAQALSAQSEAVACPPVEASDEQDQRETVPDLVSRLSDMLGDDTDFDNYSFSIKRGNLRSLLKALASATEAPPVAGSIPASILCQKCQRTISEHWDFPAVCDGFNLQEKALTKPTPPASVSGEGVTVPAKATRAWASTLANMRQGQSSTPRCEPPGEYDIDRAFASIKEVLAAAEAMAKYAKPKAAAREAAPPSKLQQVISRALHIADDAPELNMSNYDEDDVAALNTAMIEIWEVLGTAQAHIAAAPEAATPSAVVVSQADRDEAAALGKWLFEVTKGAVNLVAESDEFYTIKAFARHRLAAAPARRWYPHLDYAGEPMREGEFRDPPETEAAPTVDRDAAIERAAEYVLANSRRGNCSLNDEQRDADTQALMKAYRDIIRKALDSGTLATDKTPSAVGGVDRMREALLPAVPDPRGTQCLSCGSWQQTTSAGYCATCIKSGAAHARNETVDAILAGHAVLKGEGDGTYAEAENAIRLLIAVLTMGETSPERGTG